MQIRSLRVPYPLIQTVVLRNVRHLMQTNYALIVALDNSVCGLFPIPLGAQVCLGTLEDLQLSILRALSPTSVNRNKRKNMHAIFHS